MKDTWSRAKLTQSSMPSPSQINPFIQWLPDICERPAPKQPNHPVKLPLAAGSWARPHEIAWARSEQPKLANTFMCSMPRKFCGCFLYSILVALDNWYSRSALACVNLIVLNPRRAMSQLKCFHPLKASNNGPGLQLSQRKGASPFKRMLHIQKLPAIIFTVSLTTAFVCMWGAEVCGWREPGFDWNYGYMPRALVTCHMSFSGSKSSPPSLCSIVRGILAPKMQHSSCDSNFTVEWGTSMSRE